MHFSTLVYYELKKLFSNRIGVLLLSAVAVFMLVVSAQRYHREPEERNVWDKEQTLDGSRMDDSFFEDILFFLDEKAEPGEGSRGHHARIYAQTVFRYNDPTVTWYGPESYDNWSADLFYETRERVIGEFADAFFLTEEEKVYWASQEASMEKPFVYRSTRDIQMILETYQFSLVMTCMLTGLFLSGVFAGESEKRTNALVYSSKYGHRKTLVAKLIAGCLLSFLMGCLMLLVADLPVVFFSGLHGLDAPWYMVMPFSGITMKAGWMILLHTVVFLLGSVLTGLLTMVLSLWFDKVIAAAGTVFTLVILDLFLSVPTSLRSLSQIRYLTPGSVLMNTNVPDMRLVKLFGKYLISLQTGPIVYLFLSGFLILISVPLFRRRCRR